MSHWNRSIVFIVSILQQEIAKRISRALDPDVGGYEAFVSLASITGLIPATHCIYGAPARESFAQTIIALTNTNTPVSDRAASLKQMLDADYAARWPEHTPPTLAECEAFLTDLQVYVDASWDEALTQSGLVLYHDQVSI